MNLRELGIWLWVRCQVAQGLLEVGWLLEKGGRRLSAFAGGWYDRLLDEIIPRHNFPGGSGK